MTEVEAMRKWCPFARVRLSYEGAATSPNRAPGAFSSNVHEGSRCIGTACMAWRSTGKHACEQSSSLDMPEGDGWYPTQAGWERITRRDPNGFCGLAGAPT